MEYKYDVFISYSSKDYMDGNGKEIPGNVISIIKTLFKQNDISFWIDQKENLTGKLLSHVFADRIGEAPFFLFICSKNAVESRWAVRELSLAFSNGKMIIPFVCDDSYLDNRVSIYTDAIGRVMYKDNHGIALESLVACIKSAKTAYKMALKEKTQLIRTKICEDDHWGFVDDNGKVVVPCRYNAVANYQEGLACVESDKRKWGFVDPDGNEVIPCKWEDVGFFSEGLAYVEDAFGRIGFIDKKGKVVIPCQWEDVAPFLQGKAFVKDSNGEWHQIDKAGNYV